MVKLNLGCGYDIKEGYINVDFYHHDGVDFVQDLNVKEWGIKENSVDYILCKNVLEHLKEPELFWDNVKRILKVGGIVEVIVPHKDADGAYSTFGHRGFM